MPVGLTIGALAGAAVVVGGLLIFKSNAPLVPPSTAPVSVATPVVAENAIGRSNGQRATAAQLAVKPNPLKVKPKVMTSAAPRSNVTAATPHPTSAPAATSKPAALQQAAARKPIVRTTVAAHPSPPKHVARYGKLYQPESGSVVALGGIEAFYGPRGRAVRVYWNGSDQASAVVQLVDDRGATVNSVRVRGARQSALLYLPRGYRGALTVQVSSVGRLGERVAQTTSLPPFR
jgi:hypothetical protein